MLLHLLIEKSDKQGLDQDWRGVCHNAEQNCQWHSLKFFKLNLK